MKLQIQGFRCYENITFTADKGKLSNLSGASGAGKSTVFSAVFWCLFGSLRNIYNNAKKFKKTSVTLELHDITIYRQAKPGLLKVTFQKKEYIDKSGQEIVNQMFGSDLVWRCTSYLAQNERNVLLTGATADKMDLLSKLSFNEEDIDQYIDLIDDKISEVENSVKLNSAIVSKNYDHLESETWANFVPKDSRSDFEDFFNQLSVLIPETQERIDKNLGVQGKIGTLSESLDQLTEKIVQLEEYLLTKDKVELQTKIDYIAGELKKSETFQTQKRRYDEYTKAKAKFDPSLKFTGQVDQQSITKNKLQESEYSKSKALAVQLSVDYDSVKVQDKILETQKLIDSVPMLSKAVEYRKLKTDFDSLFEPEYSQEQLEDEIQNLKTEIKNLDQNILKCPHCTFGVIVSGGMLLKSSCAAEKKKELPDLRKKLETTLSRLASGKKYNDLKGELRKFNVLEVLSVGDKLPPSQRELQQLHIVLATLKSLKVLKEPEYTTDHLIKVFDNNLLRKKLEDLYTEDPGQLENIHTQVELSGYKIQLKELENKENSLSNLVAQREFTENKLNELKQQEDPGLESYLFGYKEQYNTVRDQLNSWSQMDKMQDKKTELDQLKYNIESDTKLLKNLQDLKKIALELECEILQSTINKINAFLNGLIRPLFDDPISIKLKVTRTTSKKGRTKPKLELQILYKGGEYDSLNDMSGGEGDRVSLALTLALNKVSSSPFILLDETMTSLNSDLQMKCLETMKDSMNKTILCIDHEAIAGFYDTVINIK